MRGVILFLLIFSPFIDSLKFLAYNPLMGASHAAYINKIAEILHDDGHEIIMISPPMSGRVKVTYPRNWTVISIPMSSEQQAVADGEGQAAAQSYWKYKSVFDFIKIIESVTNAGVNQCKVTLNHPGLLDSLKKEKFDAAFSEPIDFCGFGLFHLLDIQSYAMTLTVPSTDNTFYYTGLPAMTSFVPGMTAPFGNEMTLFQRVINTVTVKLEGEFIASQWRKYQETFDAVDPSFPPMTEIIHNSSLFVVNSDVISDFPRLTTHKIVEAGGITLVSSNASLDEHWSSILSLRPHTVLLSFGTVAKSATMPSEYKSALREAFRRFPEVTFIWKYEEPADGISDGIENIVEAPFVPQKELFNDARLTAFITHGGAGSMVEFLHAGVPVIVVPLAGEQSRSGPLVERLGTGVKVLRINLDKADEMAEAIKKVVYDPKYKQEALRISHRLKEQPFSAKERVLRNMVFMARHGPLHYLNHAGMKMGLFSYHAIDVYLILSLTLILIILLPILILRFIIRAIWRKIKDHREKQKRNKKD